MKYIGHEVLRTLIRCHFSPAETTGQQYIYSGSSDGRIHVRCQTWPPANIILTYFFLQIWSLDGQVVQVLDRANTQSMALDPSGPDHDITRSRILPCVRDVSWHSQVGDNVRARVFDAYLIETSNLF